MSFRISVGHNKTLGAFAAHLSDQIIIRWLIFVDFILKKFDTANQF